MRKLPLYTFLGANAISLIGNNLTMIAVPWFVLQTTGSATKMGLVAFCNTVPAILAGLFGGTLVDRIGHKKMSVVADLASGVTVALIPLLHQTIGLEFWHLLLLVFLSGLLDVPGGTARQALLPDVAKMGGVSLELANATAQSVQRGAMLVGPAIAGVLIAWLGSSNVLWLDAVTFLVSASLFALAVPAIKQKADSKESYYQQMKAGLKFIRQDRLIFTLVLTVAVTNFLDAPVFAILYPVYANQVFGDATALGLMISSFGAGAIFSGILFGLVGKRLSRRLTFILSFIVTSTPFWVLTLNPHFAIVILSIFIGGLGAGPLNPIIMTLAQERIPTEMRGRVLGMMTAIAWAVMPFGMLLTGVAVEHFSIFITLLVVAASYLLVTTSLFFNTPIHEMDSK